MEKKIGFTDLKWYLKVAIIAGYFIILDLLYLIIIE